MKNDSQKAKFLRKLLISATIFILSLLALFLVSLFVYKSGNNQSRLSYQYLLLEKEQNYWTSRGCLIEEIDKYIKFYAPNSIVSSYVLLNESDKVNIDIRFILVQALCESHFCTKGIAVKTNSMFNQGAFDGNTYDEILRIYKYTHPNESIAPYLKLLQKKYLGNKKVEWQLLDNFVDLNGKRYATDPNYEIALKHHLTEMQTKTPLDSLVNNYYLLKTETNR